MKKVSPEVALDNLRRLAAAMYGIGLAVMIAEFPVGHVNAHRWPYTHYPLCPWCYQPRKPGHKQCECRR